MSYKHPQSNNLKINTCQSTSSHSLINRDNHSFVFFYCVYSNSRFNDFNCLIVLLCDYFLFLCYLAAAAAVCETKV